LRRRLNLVSLKMSNHAGPSGYDRLTRALPAARVIESRSRLGLVERGLARLAQPWIARAGAAWYHRASFLCEVAVARGWLAHGHQLFHFLYGENLYRYAGVLKTLNHRRNRLVATYHTPDWRAEQVMQTREHLRRLDAVVVVSRSQASFYGELAGHDRVHFVPHGIDTAFFTPGAEEDRSRHPLLLCVGHHLRDFDVLRTAAAALWARDRRARIVIVARPDARSCCDGMPNVAFRSGLSDQELLGLYRRATALVLPLRDATANNSLLEAMACGLPVVTTDLPGVRDYVDEACAILVPSGDAAAFADVSLQVCRGQIDLAAMARAARLRALELDWSRVARLMVDVYRRVLADDA
jgi:glycosyltransferase involved in cell wall biosynthesis